ncbi:MAG: cytochrome c, partial [Chloroflexota bacterium]
AFVGLAGLAFFGLAVLRSNQRDGLNLEGLNDETRQLVIGERVYASQCGACHGVDFAGQPEWKIPNRDGTLKAPPLNEDGLLVSYSDAIIEEKIRYGAALLNDDMQRLSNMPAYDTILTDEEIDAVIAYIKAQWPPEAQEVQSQITAEEEGDS